MAEPSSRINVAELLSEKARWTWADRLEICAKPEVTDDYHGAMSDVT